MTEATYADALTRGKRYTILARDDDKAQVKVRSDNGQVHWFPLSCRKLSGQDVPVPVRIILRDAVAEVPTGAIEVEVELSDGQRRWCFVVTPEGLSHVAQAQLAGAAPAHVWCSPHDRRERDQPRRH